jgi:hypothetical protein
MSNGEPVAKVAIPETCQPASSRFIGEKVPPPLLKGTT